MTTARAKAYLTWDRDKLVARIAELEGERNTGCCDHSCWLKLAGFASSKGMGTNGGKCLCPDWKKQYAFNRLQARLARAEKVAEAAGGVADCFMVDETGDFLRGVWDRPELLKALITALAAWRAQK